MALLKFSVLFLSLSWCPAGVESTPQPAANAAGIHIHISAEAIELSIRWPRVGNSQPQARPQDAPGATL